MPFLCQLFNMSPPHHLFGKFLVDIIGIFMDCFVILLIVLSDMHLDWENHMTTRLIFSVALEYSLNGNKIHLRTPTLVSSLMGFVDNEGDGCPGVSGLGRGREVTAGCVWGASSSTSNLRKLFSAHAQPREITPYFQGKRWFMVLWRVTNRLAVVYAV